MNLNLNTRSADLAEEYTKDRKKFMKNAEGLLKKNAGRRVPRTRPHTVGQETFDNF